MKIKKHDQVLIIAGRDKGKIGEVMKVFPKEDRVIVAKINMVTKHVKPKNKTESGSMARIEQPIHASNVARFVMVDDKPVPSRIGYQSTDDGKKVRILKKTNEVVS